ncbi:iron ABC transporter permease [Phytoactinopolyspora halotolerans]|uniref:Iron ABC transporter permease n=1 Tax=Phytoactinopolyspora halotolerans TaxID=1981512 RepID=A0A6L9S3A1_9ACTN|nr:iron ABC transporter permease [Phytoactinopolyspora halotolerans]
MRTGPDGATTALGSPVRRLRIATLLAAGVVASVVLAAVHVTQGTASVDALDLVALVFGGGDQDALNVLTASRLPRVLAGVTVGLALGVAGALLQSLARNTLASPDTLGVNAGAHFAVVLAAVAGVSLPAFSAGAIATLGGLLAAALVLALSAGGASGPTRLILAGSATALTLQSMTALLILLFEEETTGLFAWGAGSLVQADLNAVQQMGPVVLVAIAASLAIGHRLDIMALGDDTASVLGINVRRTRLIVTLLAVVLAAAAVTVAGPIGFVGLCAPAIVRLLGPYVPGLYRHRVLLPAAGLAGVVIVLGADVAVRAILGAQAGVNIPTGVITTVFGAIVLIALARRHRDSGPTRRPPAARPGRAQSLRRFWIVLTACSIVLAASLLAAILLGDRTLLIGDVVNWINDESGRAITFILDSRFPRVTAAALAGAALAVAGVTVQAVCRNPLAEPGLLGITAGAGVGAVTLLALVPSAGVLALSSVAGGAALLTFGIVYALAWRAGLSSDRLVLIGIGMWSGGMAVITFIVVLTDPWNVSKALTWLSGSTYGRTMPQVLPIVVALLVLTPLVILARRELDLLSLDDDTPRVLGVRLETTRLVALGGAALLASTAVSAVGVIGFVGLVAPHAARALVGARHSRVIPVAILLGATLVSLADTIGRSVIAPAQIPAGLLTALIGTPYFVWLLWRSRV